MRDFQDNFVCSGLEELRKGHTEQGYSREKHEGRRMTVTNPGDPLCWKRQISV